MNHWEGLDVDGTIVLKQFQKKGNVMKWIGFLLLRVESSGELL
jgi:hypothetical protein